MRRILLLFIAIILLLSTGCQAPAATLPVSSQTPIPTPIILTETPAPVAPAPTEPDPTPTATLTPTSALSETLALPLKTATQACTDGAGTIVIHSLESALLSEPLDFRVYLPPCYRQDHTRRYPVLYLIHGQSYNDDQWDRLGADETASRLISSGEITPFLIVMPRDRVWSQPGDDPFGRAILEELIPWVDSHYRTLPDRQHRAVGGLSRGAGWAVHLALSQWETFGILGAHSLPVFWADVFYIKTWLKAIPPESYPRIYLDIGQNDRTEIMNSAVWFEKLLTDYGIPHEWHMFSGYHDEAYWSSHLEQYLRFYAADW